MSARNHNRILILIYMTGFLCGILYMNLVLKQDQSSMGIFSEYFLRQSTEARIDRYSYLWYLIKLRILPAAGLGLMGLTGIRRIGTVLFLIWTGFLFGMIFTAALWNLGIKGILLCVVSLIPQILFYVVGYGILLSDLLFYTKNRWNFQKTITVFLAICIGVAVECYMNTVLVKYFLKII